MQRPSFITEQDIRRWDENIDNDPFMPKEVFDSLLLREITYAGCWLGEKLQQEGCAEELIVRIQYTMGGLSFGHDPWEVAQDLLTAYQNNELEFEMDYNEDTTAG